MSVGVVALIGTGTAVNFVSSVKAGRDPFPSLLAAAILGWICIGVDSFAPRIGTAVAAGFLLVSLLDNGEEFAGSLSAATAPTAPKGK